MTTELNVLGKIVLMSDMVWYNGCIQDAVVGETHLPLREAQ